jgi:hypothetical protein
MALTDLRPSSQWTVEGATGALPPPTSPRVQLSGRAVVIACARGATLDVITEMFDLGGGFARALGRALGAELSDLPAFILTPSAFIDPGGEVTTAQLTPPSGKTTSDFQAGTIQDDENPAAAVDLGEDKYTEIEWSIEATTAVEPGAEYEWRVAKE